MHFVISAKRKKIAERAKWNTETKKIIFGIGNLTNKLFAVF